MRACLSRSSPTWVRTKLEEASIDVFRKSRCSIRTCPSRSSPIRNEMGVEDGEEIISSATELELFGIQLETSKTGSLEDISFAVGVLRLPANVVDDTTESTLLNLMTFEHFHHGAGNDTAYIIFLDDIIANEQNVALLNT